VSYLLERREKRELLRKPLVKGKAVSDTLLVLVRVLGIGGFVANRL
jgi:hypothetical protein